MNEIEKLNAWVSTLERPLGPRWSHSGRPHAAWRRWRAHRNVAERLRLYINSGVMEKDELRPLGALYLQQLGEANRAWRAWLREKRAFDRSRRNVN